MKLLSHSVVSDSLWPHGLQHTWLSCPWNSSGKNTGVGCHFLLQGIFLTQGWNLGLLHCRPILYHLSHQGSHPRWGLSLKKKKGKEEKQRELRRCCCNYASSSKTLYFLQNMFLSCTENAAFMWTHDCYKKVIPINYNKIWEKSSHYMTI